MTPSAIVPQRTLLYKTPTGTPTYISWRNMLARTKATHKNAHRYYNRGIHVCDRWMNFDNFVEDMGLRPEGKTIDRIDNDRGYEPGNCQWASQKDQCSNKENCRLITIDGETHTLKEWDRVRGFRPNVVWYRLNRGWSERDAVLLPLIKTGPKFKGGKQ